MNKKQVEQAGRDDVSGIIEQLTVSHQGRFLASKPCEHDWTQGLMTHLICPKCDRPIGIADFEKEIRSNERTQTAKEILFMLSSLDTTELKEKAPVCSLKLKQVIEKIKKFGVE